mmetsp:Transcript_2662/g.6106  ORF Transcript_2662/g.6106 Transcript_2662/m.6106 type:complete len:293 (+) Transcript_2662:335-1213(+)
MRMHQHSAQPTRFSLSSSGTTRKPTTAMAFTITSLTKCSAHSNTSFRVPSVRLSPYCIGSTPPNKKGAGTTNRTVAAANNVVTKYTGRITSNCRSVSLPITHCDTRVGASGKSDNLKSDLISCSNGGKAARKPNLDGLNSTPGSTSTSSDATEDIAAMPTAAICSENGGTSKLYPINSKGMEPGTSASSTLAESDAVCFTAPKNIRINNTATHQTNFPLASFHASLAYAFGEFLEPTLPSAPPPDVPRVPPLPQAASVSSPIKDFDVCRLAAVAACHRSAGDRGRSAIVVAR